jgi:hypothetical protein
MRNILIAALCLVMVFFAGRHQARQEIQEQVTRIESKMVEASREAEEQLKKERQAHETKTSSLKSAVADGSLRLYVRTSEPSCSTSGATENGAELDRQVAQDLISIASDGDKAVIQLNSCIDLYNNIKEIK